MLPQGDETKRAILAGLSRLAAPPPGWKWEQGSGGPPDPDLVDRWILLDPKGFEAGSVASYDGKAWNAYEPDPGRPFAQRLTLARAKQEVEDRA